MYKRIRLYFINKNIKKIQNDIQRKINKIEWIKKHLHDIDILHSTAELNNINCLLELDKMLLDSYKQDKERIESL